MRHLARTTVVLCLLTALAGQIGAPVSADHGSAYLVLYKKHDTPTSVSADVARAGGTLVIAYDEIGVAVARSGSPSFAANLERDPKIEGVASTTGFGVKVEGVAAEASVAEGP